MAFLSVKSLIGEGYDEMWFTNCHARYRIFKGGRNTKKSHNIGGVEPIIKILSNKCRNIMMIRQNDVDNADSTYTNLVQRINDMGLAHLFSCIKSPYKITRKATGQVILFRGMNNPESITSAKPAVGLFTDFYFEEASQLDSYEEFRKVDGTLRGRTPEGVYLQITFMLNPWDIDSWIYDKFCKDRFEDNEAELESKHFQVYKDDKFNIGFGKGLAIHTSSYKINEFRAPDYDDGAEELRKVDYESYKTEFLGLWGNTSEGCYPCFNEGLKIPAFAANTMTYTDFAIGIDIGLSDGQGKVNKKGEIRSATTMMLVGINTEGKMVCMDEYYFSNIIEKYKKTEPEIQDDLLKKIRYWLELYPWMINRPIHILVDSADKGFREGMEKTANSTGMGYLKFLKSTKLPIHDRISFTNRLMAFGELLISDNCKNLCREFKQTHRNEEKGLIRDGNDHSIDAYEYAATPLWGKMRRYGTFKFAK